MPAGVTDIHVLAENLVRIPLPLEIAKENAHNQKCMCERKQREKEVIMQMMCLLVPGIYNPLVVTLS